MAQMDDDALIALIDQLSANTYSGDDGILSNERAQAIARYNSEPWGDEVEGRSQLVSSQIRDTVETALPQWLRIFLGGDDVVCFDPEGEEDEKQAEQETDYVNFVVQQRNPAFQIFSTWFRDAALCKNGYVLAQWETRSDIKREAYQGLTEDQYTLIKSDQSVQITAEEAYPEPGYQPPPMPAAQAMSMGQGPMSPPPVPMLYNVECRRVRDVGRVRIDNVPPEEIKVHISQRDVNFNDECLYLEHSRPMTLSEVRQMGYEVPDDWAGSEDDLGLESVARDRFQANPIADFDTSDPATRMCQWRHIWMRADRDGDGVAELLKVCMVNRHVLHVEETDIVPVACITPVIQPHRHIGYGYYDFLKDIESASTAAVRAMFDNAYLAVHGRYGVDTGKVNIDDMLTSRPGGIVRTEGDPHAAIMPLTHPTDGSVAGGLVQFLDAWKKNATGVVMDAQALSADTLSTSTAAGISQAISAWQARIEGVARCFAETGVKELFRIVHALTLKNATGPEKVKLRNEWVTVDPREWVKRHNLTVTVGLGTGSKEAKVMFLQQAIMQAGQAMSAGLPMIQPQNLYEMSKELWKEAGYKSTQRFLTDPAKAPQPEPKKPEAVQVEEIRQQGKQGELQAQGQLKMAEIQANAQAKEREQQAALLVQQQNDERDMAAQERRAQLDREKMMLDHQLNIERMNREFEFKYWDASQRHTINANRPEPAPAND